MVEIRKLTIAIFLLVISVSLVACDTAQDDGSGTSGDGTPGMSMDGAAVGTVVKTEKGQYTNISAEELKAMLEKKDFFLMDVHVPNEGKMPDLDARIPYDQIAQELDQLPRDKGAKIVLTCMSDSMSTMASMTLADLGYTNVFNLVGGYNAWRAKGYPFTPEP